MSDARGASPGQRGSMLVLTPRFPFPLLAGDAIRIFQVCSALAAEWDLTLLSICQSRQEMAQSLPVDSPFRKVHRIFLPRWQSYIQAALAAVTGEPLQIAYYRSGAFRRAVRRLAGDHDVLLCHLLRTAPYANEFAGPRLLELTDHLPLTYARTLALKRSGGGILRLAYKFEAGRLSSAQQRYARQFELVSFVSSIDRELFEQETAIGRERTIQFPVSVDLAHRPFVAGRRGAKIAFVGNLRTLQNRDAVMYFCEEILPLIRARIPGASLKVIGAVEAGFKRGMSSVDGLEFAGVVPSVAAALADCCIGVCPVRISAGMQNKVLDYMSLGLAAVSTKQGAEGLTVTDGKQLLVAENPSDFADAAVRLLSDAALRNQLAAEARLLVESEYALEANMGRFRSQMRHRIRW